MKEYDPTQSVKERRDRLRALVAKRGKKQVLSSLEYLDQLYYNVGGKWNRQISTRIVGDTTWVENLL